MFARRRRRRGGSSRAGCVAVAEDRPESVEGALDLLLRGSEPTESEERVDGGDLVGPHPGLEVVRGDGGSAFFDGLAEGVVDGAAVVEGRAGDVECDEVDHEGSIRGWLSVSQGAGGGVPPVHVAVEVLGDVVPVRVHDLDAVHQRGEVVGFLAVGFTSARAGNPPPTVVACSCASVV